MQVSDLEPIVMKLREQSIRYEATLIQLEQAVEAIEALPAIHAQLERNEKALKILINLMRKWTGVRT